MDELLDIVNEQDRVIGQALRSACHGNPELIHRAVHVLVFNGRGRLLLQKRPLHKDVQPGRWDTSVGGHLDVGEGYYQGALREMGEELGIVGRPLAFLYRYHYGNDVETEYVTSWWLRYDGLIPYNTDELDGVAFYAADEIDQMLGTGLLTPNFEQEWRLFKQWAGNRGGFDVLFSTG